MALYAYIAFFDAKVLVFGGTKIEKINDDHFSMVCDGAEGLYSI